MSESFTPAQVATHNTADNGLYIIIDTNVYDVTNFIDEHPGGARILKLVAGKDASKQFWKVSFALGITSAIAQDKHQHQHQHSNPAPVPQRVRAKEIHAQTQDRRSEGRSETVDM